MAVVVVVDLSVDTFALLIQLLLVGPLIAATGATVRQTIVVAVVALAVSIPLVAGDDAFGSDRYFVATAVLIMGGALSVIIARLRSHLQRDSARLQAQYNLARVIGDSTSFDDAAPRLLGAIAPPLGRQIAQFWVVQEDGTLRCVAHWHKEGTDFDAFERASRELTFQSGQGLPGQAWEAGRPVWLGDALAAGTFVRAAEAEEADLHGGMAFPVIGGQGCIGVIELYSHEIRERDAGVYALSEALGRQVGEFVEALRLEQEREEARVQLEAILRGVADAVTAQAPDGRLLFANEAAAASMGFESPRRS